MLNPDINDYQLTSIITECCGGVAVVYSAQYKPTDKNVAIKRYFVDKCKEKANLIQLKHANILPYLTSFVHGRELYVVSPLMTFGSGRDILDRYFQEGLPELACALILRDALLALQYLHKQLYIHRLPPQDHDNANLMWLMPFAEVPTTLMFTEKMRGSRPQLLDCSTFPQPCLDDAEMKIRSDIYSVGVVCCELGNGAVPFAEVPTTLMFTEKMRGSRPQLLDCSTFPQPCLDDAEMKSKCIYADVH
ncbi:putative serologically defined breast cancer antigen NY-BR-96 [Operophtera brumata]|uniref:Putative serologically defined breast cancer antigen NY-BR-96 n=1 Tax=Operophtera brumata TaxID=104452 RepID=A0A0L7L4D7_OPEBR|nr:putative serologically defined breast cancer antigen NY-BR-96 [Operophtera brumata]